jgi:hypothetical protein
MDISHDDLSGALFLLGWIFGSILAGYILTAFTKGKNKGGK